jgi:hypothetical protein
MGYSNTSAPVAEQYQQVGHVNDSVADQVADADRRVLSLLGDQQQRKDTTLEKNDPGSRSARS